MKTVGATRQRSSEALTHDLLIHDHSSDPASADEPIVIAVHHASAAPDEELLTRDAGSVPMSRATNVSTMTN